MNTSIQGTDSSARRLAIFISVLLIGAAQYATPTGATHWLYILQRLYYLPIAFAGLTGGWRLGLSVALTAGACFAVGTPAIWSVTSTGVLDQCLEMMIFALVGIGSGILTDRDRRQKAALHETTVRLQDVYGKLQDNFERMKRTEKLSALGQLSAGLAHEIRNPLASIEGAARVLQRETQPEEHRREFLDIIQKESRRLNGLLTSFLNFARPRQLTLQWIDVQSLVESVVALARHAGTREEMHFEERFEPGLPEIECDPEQIKQVLLNLAMNAVQAMPEGGIVRFEAYSRGPEIVIDVQDRGPGIDPANAEHVFDPFFTTKEGGSGLGLSVAHQIVTQHGGTLTIAHNSGEGVTFRMSLPLRQNR